MRAVLPPPWCRLALLAGSLVAIAPWAHGQETFDSEDPPAEAVPRDAAPPGPWAPEHYRGQLLPGQLQIAPSESIPIQALLRHYAAERTETRAEARQRERRRAAAGKMTGLRVSGWVLYGLGTSVEVAGLVFSWLWAADGDSAWFGAGALGTPAHLTITGAATLLGSESAMARALASKQGLPDQLPELAITAWTAAGSGFLLGVVMMGLTFSFDAELPPMAVPALQTASFGLLTASCILFAIDAGEQRARVQALDDVADLDATSGVTVMPIAGAVPGGVSMGLAGSF